ncbi:hypothetical protein [Bradyrhizobium sp. WSM3983]|nr:hypothetical protein [Bradyrhizobium sp. WSM3983]
MKYDGGSFKLAIDDIYLFSLDAKDPITGHVFDVKPAPGSPRCLSRPPG